MGTFGRAIKRLSGVAQVAALAGVAISTSVRADTGHQETWRCNAPNGHYSRNVLAISPGTSTISGFITYHKPDLGPRWPSTARIAFTDSTMQSADCHCNGATVSAYQGIDHIEFSMLADGQYTGIAQSPFRTPMPFKISIDPKGAMQVKIGSAPAIYQTAQLPHPNRDTIIMSCSGADVSFLDVELQ